jgi:hypothetical protein
MGQIVPTLTCMSQKSARPHGVGGHGNVYKEESQAKNLSSERHASLRSEGSGCRGGMRRERYHNALGSTRETGACLDVAEALGYLAGVAAVLRDRLDFLRATLVKNIA